MPVVLRVDGFTVVVLLPPREHGPAHVHVSRAGTEVIIILSPIEVREVHGMSSPDVIRAVRIVDEHRVQLLQAWRRHHDHEAQ